MTTHMITATLLLGCSGGAGSLGHSSDLAPHAHTDLSEKVPWLEASRAEELLGSTPSICSQMTHCH